MENKFKEVMTKRSDSELLEIVTKHRNDYQKEAVEAAESEIKNRNLSEDQIDKAKEDILTKEKNQKGKEIEPLQTGQKILFFIFFWGVIPWAMAGTFKSNGNIKKYKDAWKMMKYGLLTFIGIDILILLVVYLSF